MFSQVGPLCQNIPKPRAHLLRHVLKHLRRCAAQTHHDAFRLMYHACSVGTAASGVPNTTPSPGQGQTDRRVVHTQQQQQQRTWSPICMSTGSLWWCSISDCRSRCCCCRWNSCTWRSMLRSTDCMQDVTATDGQGTRLAQEGNPTVLMCLLTPDCMSPAPAVTNRRARHEHTHLQLPCACTKPGLGPLLY